MLDSWTLNICPPAVSHATGFMTQEERKKFESLHSDFNKYWIPCVWFTNLAAQARRDGRVRDDVALRLLIDVSLQGLEGQGMGRGGVKQGACCWDLGRRSVSCWWGGAYPRLLSPR